MRADPKPIGRISDPEMMARLHLEWMCCALCGRTDRRLSLHHVLKHPRQDLREGLVMLCGDGVQGCHGLVEAHDPKTISDLAWHIFWDRPDTLEFMGRRMGEEAALDWIQRSLLGHRGLG